MSEEIAARAEEVETKAGAKSFFKKHADIFFWLPVAIYGMLGIVLLLAPLAYLLPEVFALIGVNPTGYVALGYMSTLDAGMTVPVILLIAIGGVCLVFAAVGSAIYKFRCSLSYHLVACALGFIAFLIGLVQAIWLGAQELSVGAFAIVCIVFGIFFAVLAIGVTVIRCHFIATEEEKIRWGVGFNRVKPWLYLTPAIILLLVFTVWPIINTIRISFMVDQYGLSYNGAKEVGGLFSFHFSFQNYVRVVSFYRFKNCLGTTMLLTVLTVPISTMLALLIAVALNSIKWLKKIFQTIFFLPYVTNTIAIGMVFMAMFHMVGGVSGTGYESIGIINTILKLFGIGPIDWVDGTSSYAAEIAVLTIYIVWNALPFKILVLLGGLQSVNKQYYEAAKIDGTSRARTFWRITVPMLSPMIAYVVITGFIGGFKEYSSIVGIFGYATDQLKVDTMVGFIYESIAGQSEGEASAAALILFLIIFAVTMINMYVGKKKVHY